MTCIRCGKAIDASLANRCSNSLFRLFLSGRILKKVSFADLACRRCRWRFDNWVKRTKDDFSDLIASNNLEMAMVNIHFSDSHLQYHYFNQDEDTAEKSVQTESELRTIEIPISRATASHRLVKLVVDSISFE